MSVNELRTQEVSRVKDGLLDSSISTVSSGESVTAKLQREAELLRDGLSTGFQARVEHAKEHAVATTLEVAGSFGLGAGLAAMSKAGGRWGTAAKVVGGAFTVMLAGDVSRRAIPTFGAMSDTWDSDLNMTQNKQIVGHYAGGALFDYPVMLASGMAGAGAVHFAPRMTEFLRTKEATLSSPLGMEMSLGEAARLGAKEKTTTATADPLADIRASLELPSQKVFGLGELAKVMEARRLASHAEVAPVRGSMIEALGKVDQLKPELNANRTALQGAEKQLADVKGLKAEKKAVEQAERSLNALDSETARLGELKGQETQLQAALRKKGEEAPTDPAAVREELGLVRQDIRAAQDRLAGRPTAEAKVAEAKAAMEARQKQIEAGTDPEVTALNDRIASLRDAVSQGEAKLGELTAELNRLNTDFVAKQDAVRPNLDESVMPGPVQELVKVKPEAAKPKVEPKPAAENAASPTATGDVTPTAKPGQLGAPAQTAETTLANMLATHRKDAGSGAHSMDAWRADLGKRVGAEAGPKLVADTPKVSATTEAPAARRAEVNPPAESQGHRPQQSRPENRAPQNDRSARPRERVEQRPVEVVGEREVTRALQDARRAVDDFAATGKRHTTALKGITEYIDKSFQWFGNDAAAMAKSGEVLGNVNAMLAKVKNWERGASWIPKQGPERATLMQRNGMSADQMAKFDAWYETVRDNYQPKGNQQTESVLADIHAHLEQRVMVESVKWYLKQAPDTVAAVSPIVNKGFQMIRDGQYPNGRPIHDGADIIVFEKRTVQGPEGPMEVILPFAKDGQHIQRFDAANIVNGMAKQEVMASEGPSAFPNDVLRGFRIDHDPIRLAASREQVGFAILRPGGHGKNIAYMEFAPNVDAALIPKQLRADSAAQSGTNTGSIYNMLRQMTGNQRQSRPANNAGGSFRPQQRPSGGQSELPSLEIQ